MAVLDKIFAKRESGELVRQGLDGLVAYHKNINTLSDNPPFVNARDYISKTSTGGEAIQAAIDDLPDRGGRVFIPSEGPDTVDNESGVWELDKTISTGNKNGVWIIGESPGWKVPESGTTLIASTDLSIGIHFEGGFIDGIGNIRLDAGTSNSGDAIRLGKGGQNDFQIWSTMIHNWKKAVRVNCTINVWINSCWLQLNTDGIYVSSFNEWLWMNNILCWSNFRDLNVTTDINGLWLQNYRSEQLDGSPILINNNSTVTSAKFAGMKIEDGPDSAFKITSGSTLRNSVIDDVEVSGNSNIPHAIENNGTIKDTRIDKVRAKNITGSKFVNIINDTSNAPRATIDGVGYNGANNPASAGVWNGEGREGVEVLWDDSGKSRISKYVNGTWIQLN